MNHTQAVNVYDFDHTIYDGDASVDFIKYCLSHDLRLWRYLPADFLALATYTLGMSDRKQIKQVAFTFLRDLPDIDNTLNKFWAAHEHKVKPWYHEQHRSTDIVISASPAFLLDPIARNLGIRTTLATPMNKHTGKIDGENCRGEEKLRRLKAYDPKIKVDKFYSDSMSDLPLLKLANEPYIVHGHAVTLLNKKALQR